MTVSRDSFLQRVRQAVADGNRPGMAARIASRGNMGYQGAGPDPVLRFRDELAAAGGHLHIAPNRAAVLAALQELVHAGSGRKILLGNGPFIDGLNLLESLDGQGFEIVGVNRLKPDAARETFFAADIGISGVEYLIAETGTVVMAAGTGDPRSVSLLPPVHIALAERRQLLPDLFDLFAVYAGTDNSPALPSCLTLITGPSKTGDIELRLVTGVHGPGELHVILLSC